MRCRTYKQANQDSSMLGKMDGGGERRDPFLHTCLSRFDFMAFFAELPKTNNLFARDRGGRTVMELAMHMAIDLFQSCFSTSFPIDSSALGRYSSCQCAVCSHKRHRGMRDGEGENKKEYPCKNPMRVRYNEEYRNMYLQPKHMRINSKLASPCPSLHSSYKYTPVQYPPGLDGEVDAPSKPLRSSAADAGQGKALASESTFNWV